MIFAKTKAVLGLGVILFVGGCASVPREAGFGAVGKTVAERTGRRVHWNQGSASDEAVAQTVKAMLAKELSADEVVQIALLNNRNLQATYEDLAVAQADLVSAGLLRNPVFDAQIRFSTAGGGTGVEMALVQDFIELLYIPLRKNLAQAAFEAATLRVSGEVLEMAGEVRSAFYRVQASEQMLAMRRQVVKATGASVDFAERLRAAGNTTELDLANERALAGQSRLDLRSAEAQVTRDRERLTTLMGVWGEQTQWTVSPRLPEPLAEDESADGLEKRAVERSLDLAAARLEITQAARKLGIAAPFAALPEGELGVSAERDPAGGWNVGPSFMLPIPLFNQGQPAIAEAQAVLRRTRAQYAAKAVEVRSRARRLYSEVAAARDQVEFFEQAVLPLRKQIVKQSQLQYNAMQIGPIQLLLAKQQQIDTGATYIRMLRDYWLARAELDLLLNGRIARFGGQDLRNEMMTTTTAGDSRGGH